MRTHHETDAIKLDDTTWGMFCVECGNKFESQRSDAAFCGATCRSRYHRKEKNRQRDIDLMLQYVVKVCDNMKKRGDSPEFDALNKAIKHASWAISRVESQ